MQILSGVAVSEMRCLDKLNRKLTLRSLPNDPPLARKRVTQRRPTLAQCGLRETGDGIRDCSRAVSGHRAGRAGRRKRLMAEAAIEIPHHSSFAVRAWAVSLPVVGGRSGRDRAPFTLHLQTKACPSGEAEAQTATVAV